VETTPGAKSSGIESGRDCPRKGPERSGKGVSARTGSVVPCQERSNAAVMAIRRPIGRILL